MNPLSQTDNGNMLQLAGIQFNRTQQSVQWICGSLRGLQAFFWLRVFSALKHFPSPPTNH
jgi:hypothetical protein